MEKKFKVFQIKGYYDNVLTIHKFTRYIISNIKEEEEKLFLKYKNLGVKVQYIELIYTELRRDKINPVIVYEYIKNNGVWIDEAASHFDIGKQTVKQYLRKVEDMGLE